MNKRLPGGSKGKESACNSADWVQLQKIGKMPWRRAGEPTPVFLPGEFHGQRSLVGYSQWGHKVLDMAE